MPHSLTLLALAATLVALGACATPHPKSAPPLRVYGNLSTIELAPVLLAVKGGLYASPATLTNGGIPNLYGEGGVAGISEPGTADIATNAETQALRASVAHPDLRIIMTVSEGLYRIVARRSAGIKTLADLKGKRIGTLPNTSSAYFLAKMLKTAGLSETDVTIVPLWPIDSYKTALANKEVDAIAIWEPGAEYAMRSLGNDAIEFDGKGIYRELFNLNTKAANLADPAMRAKIVSFVASLLSASALLRADPKEAQNLVADSAGYGAETVAAVWRHHAYPGDLVPDLLDVMTQEDVWVARETKRAPRPRADLAKLIDASVIADARKLLGTR